VATAAFWFFNQYCNRHYKGRRDGATKEQLTEKNKKFEFQKMFELPWTFWAVMAFSIFQTSAASVFSQNATELAEKRFNVDSIKAGWYSSLSQYAGKICSIFVLHPKSDISQASSSFPAWACSSMFLATEHLFVSFITIQSKPNTDIPSVYMRSRHAVEYDPH
jgi:hypothetical protein